jgi:hypothetical protein
MVPILTCVLLLSPRVALITIGEAELARAEVESAGLEVVPVDAAAVPLGGRLAALAEERGRLGAALEEARGLFVATRFADARAVTDRAEKEAQFRGEPEVARRLAELAVMAALCGDKDGFGRAAAYHPQLKLDPARWSPDARAGYERAQKRTADAHLSLDEGVIFVDGVRAAAELDLPPGRHEVFALLPGRFHAGESVEVSGRVHFTPTTSPAGADEELPLIALRLQAGDAPSDDELRRVSEHFAADAALVAEPVADWRERLRKKAQALVADCSLRHQPPERARAQKPLTLSVSAGRCVLTVKGEFHAGPRTWTADAPVAGGAARLEVAADRLPASDRPYVLEYRLWGETPHHAAAGALGPNRVLIESAPIPHWYRKWWVWTLVGAAVTAAVVIPSVLATRGPPTTDVRIVGSGGGN